MVQTGLVKVFLGAFNRENSDDQEPCRRGRSLDWSRGLRLCAKHNNRHSRRHGSRDTRPRDPPPDPGGNPRPDGVAFKPDAASRKHEQGKD